jgi:hypothetical protein
MKSFSALAGALDDLARQAPDRNALSCGFR